MTANIEPKQSDRDGNPQNHSWSIGCLFASRLGSGSVLGALIKVGQFSRAQVGQFWRASKGADCTEHITQNHRNSLTGDFGLRSDDRCHEYARQGVRVPVAAAAHRQQISL